MYRCIWTGVPSDAVHSAVIVLTLRQPVLSYRVVAGERSSVATTSSTSPRPCRTAHASARDISASPRP